MNSFDHKRFIPRSQRIQYPENNGYGLSEEGRKFDMQLNISNYSFFNDKVQSLFIVVLVQICSVIISWKRLSVLKMNAIDFV